MGIKQLAETSLPNSSLYNNRYDLDTHRWSEWTEYVPSYSPPEPFRFYNIYVPTAENVLYSSLLEGSMEMLRPTLFVGEPGTTKTMTIQKHLDTLDSQRFRLLNINMSSRTTSMNVQ